MLIVERLKNREIMSNAESAVADYLLEHGRDLERYSTRDLADAAFTSAATVVRLCKKLGFRGFEEFKEKYLEEQRYLEQRGGDLDANFPFSKTDNSKRAAWSISQLYRETIDDTMSLLHYGDLQKATRLMCRASRIHVFSFGTCLNQAESFREKMLKIGKPVSISSNLDYQLYEAACLSPRDLAIAISYSGETEKILTVARLCHDRRVPVLALTSFGENSLTEFADCKLTVSTKQRLSHNAADFSTHVSVMLLLDILYSSFFLQDYDEFYQHKIKLSGQLEKRRTTKNALIMDEGTAGEIERGTVPGSVHRFASTEYRLDTSFC